MPGVCERGSLVPLALAAAGRGAAGRGADEPGAGEPLPGEPRAGVPLPGSHWPRSRGARGQGAWEPPSRAPGGYVAGSRCVPRSRLLSSRMQGAGKALHELLLSAQRQGCLTAGVYESAKVLNV